jgi:transglutaminase-like putative cysteine protease
MDSVSQLPPPNDTTWVLLPGKTNLPPVSIACYLPGTSGGKALLPLPEGTARLENLPVWTLQKSQFGGVLAEGPGLVIFDAFYGPGATIDSPPNAMDGLEGVPDRETNALERVISEMQVRGQNLDQTLQTLRAFFMDKFSYGFWTEIDLPRGTNDTPVGQFLLKTRHGHCEYFATATVLLLRELGFSARYAVGYAVHEASGKKYLVRERDAHAWCLVYRNGVWEPFDTTPPTWVEEEAKRASFLQSLSDFRSWLWFQFSKFRWGQTHLRQYILLGLIPVLGILLYQILFRSRRQRGQLQARAAGPADSWPGTDSEFYRLEEKLRERGLQRAQSEPLTAWLQRAAADPALSDARVSLEQLLLLHYRYRFDPLGLDENDRAELRRQAAACLESLDKVGVA